MLPTTRVFVFISHLTVPAGDRSPLERRFRDRADDAAEGEGGRAIDARVRRGPRAAG